MKIESIILSGPKGQVTLRRIPNQLVIQGTWPRTQVAYPPSAESAAEIFSRLHGYEGSSGDIGELLTILKMLAWETS